MVFLKRPLFSFGTIVIKAWGENNGELETRHFRKEFRLKIFKTVRNGGCRSPVFQVKTDSVSGEIHVLFPVLGFLEAGLNFEKSLLKSAFRHFKGSGIVFILSQTSSF